MSGTLRELRGLVSLLSEVRLALLAREQALGERGKAELERALDTAELVLDRESYTRLARAWASPSGALAVPEKVLEATND
ncbi:MAG: hypothetical protein ACHQQS_06740 [Thermoanaerobaculales bacterium]